MNQEQVFDGSQACFPVPCGTGAQTGHPLFSDFLQGYHFNGMPTLPATQIPQHPSQPFAQWMPVVGQGNGEPSQQTCYFIPDWLKHPPPPGHNLLLEWIPDNGFTNGQNATLMPEVNQESLKTEPPFNQNWTPGAGYFIPDWLKHPPPPGHNLVLEWIPDNGFTNGQNATLMPEVNQESLKTEPPFNQNWTPGAGYFIPDWLKHPPPPGHNLVLEWIPDNGSTGDLAGLKPPTTSSLPQGEAGGGAHTFKQPEEEWFWKRQLRLKRNRIAAKASRQKKKNYIKDLETRVAMLENEHKSLIEELTVLEHANRIKME